MLQAEGVEPHVPMATTACPRGGSGRATPLTVLLLLLGLALAGLSGYAAGHSSTGAAPAPVHESAAPVADATASADEIRHADEGCEHDHESDSCPQCPSCSGALPLGFTSGPGPIRPGDHLVYRSPFREVALEDIPRPPRRS